MRRILAYAVVTLALIAGGVLVSAQLDLTTFTPNTPILAEEVNANFEAIGDAIAAAMLPVDCDPGQTAEWDGAAWGCGEDDVGGGGGGDITEVIAGDGLTGGGDTGTITLAADAELARDAEIMPTVLANDGSGSTLDADTLDGLDAFDVAQVGHINDFIPKVGNGVGGSDCAGGELEVLIEDVFGQPADYRFTFITPGSNGGYGQIRSDGSIRSASSNVSSVTRAGVGSYCVAFTVFPGGVELESTVVGLATN